MSVLSKGIISSILVVSLMSPVSAASLQDKYEVARTKLLYLLSINDFNEASALVAEKSSLFTGSSLEGDWLYLEGLVAAKQGNLEQAAFILRQLHTSSLDNKQWLFDLAVVELKLNNPESAEKALTAWLAEHPNHVPGRYYLAMSHYQQANYKSAIDVLLPLEEGIDAAATTNITPDKIYYLLAASAYKGNQSALALRSAKKVVVMGNSDYEASANVIINNVRSERTKIWSVELSGKASYDSNVALAIDSEAQEDVRGTLQIDASIQPVRPITLNYNGALTEHAEVSEYNLQSHKVKVHVNPGFKVVPTGFGYSYSQSFLDKAEWQHQHRLFLESQWQKLAVNAELSSLLYPDSESQNGFVGGINGAYTVTKANALPLLSINAGAKAQVNEQWEAKSLSAQTGAAFVAMVSNWQLQAKGDVSYTEYAPGSVQESKLMASTSFVGSRILFSNLRLTLSADSFWVLASPEQFDYQRYVLSSALAWRF
ncbi:tetratricopeptide repeat protein [Reinekea marina]|uniref:Tetratricopeptide repeat protein n=1 Tax=Reinekea marina TaxID=1310421 RepID=A0ABV7WW25_9GAMM|nr:tetratricopeptide repeat protein [Reinekea marina]MDN3649837.1 tetratricopeptide repeat protein [Reinekea marina]